MHVCLCFWQSCQVPATACEQVVRLLETLPPPPSRTRPAPSFAGAALPLASPGASSPLRRSLFSSTLSQLSNLAASASLAMDPSPGPAPGGRSVVQIWPVAAVAGGRAGASAAPSLALTLGGPPDRGAGGGPHGGPGQSWATSGGDRQGGGAGARRQARECQGGEAEREAGAPAAELRLRQATVWLSLPMLQRLEAFLAPLALAQARAALLRMEEAAPPGASVRAAGGERCFAELALDSVLDDLQDLRTTATGARAAGSAAAELRCWAPHMCVVLQLPAPAPAPSAPVCHGYGFAAVDIFAAPAAPAVPGEASPMLVLHAGGDGAQAGGACDVAAVVGHAKAFLVGSRVAGAGAAPPGDVLQASCIAEVLPGASGKADAADALPRCPGAAVAVDVRWAPAAVPDPALIDRAWAFVRDQALAAASDGSGVASGDGGGASGIAAVELQDTVVASSALVVRVRAPQIRLWLSQARNSHLL